MSDRQFIVRTALTSRLILVLIQYIANRIIPDHEANAFRYVKAPNGGPIDDVVANIFGGFVRWDAHYFMHIARHGYSFEHTLAFFPLYPILVKHIVAVLSWVVPFLNLDSLTIVTFLIINLICFVLSALCLYDLSELIVGKALALRASILFCFNPASVFFTAPYTESLFCYLTFRSMLNCVLLYTKYCDRKDLQVKDVAYIFPLCLGTCTRSNGLLNVGFLVYALICIFLDKRVGFRLVFVVKSLLLTLFLVGLCIIPFLTFQAYSYIMFCNDFQANLAENFDKVVLPGTFSQHNQTWCHNKIPLAYSYIQSHYWGVGFLQYYQLKQIPNFILAFPAVYILLHDALIFFKRYPKNLAVLFNFNLIHKRSHCAEFSPTMLVFVIHSTLLTMFCVLNIHVQVTTRMMCSASPLLYWFVAYKISFSAKNNIIRRYGFREYLFLGYFLGYYVIGTVMFCNFLPWT